MPILNFNLVLWCWNLNSPKYLSDNFCSSESESATFNGQSRLTYDVSGNLQYLQSRRDVIKLRFRTNEANGVILFADGNQGDYIVLELLRGRLYLNMDLGASFCCLLVISFFKVFSIFTTIIICIYFYYYFYSYFYSHFYYNSLMNNFRYIFVLIYVIWS